MGIEGTHLNIIKSMYDKPIATIILNSEKFKDFPLRSEQEYPLSPLLFTTVLEILDRQVSQEKEIKASKSKRQQNCHYLLMT